MTAVFLRRIDEPEATLQTSRRRVPPDGPILEVENLEVALGGASIVDRLSFSLRPGRTLAIVGESGCGKSVTALAIMGLLAKGRGNRVAGHVRFEGSDLTALDARALADLRGDRIAMIFQEPMTALNPVLRIGEQLTEAILRHRGGSARAARDRAAEMLRLVRVPDPEARLRAWPHELSGGMRQRVMIAMALANDPALLVADEPTTALDVTIQAQILALVGDLQRETGAAMMLITHDLGVVAEVADDVAVMYAGRIVEAAPAALLFESPQHPYTLGLMSSVPALARRGRRENLATIPGAVPPPRLYGGGCRFAPRCAFALPRCTAERPTLWEVEPGHRVACIRAPLEETASARAAA